MPTTWRGDLSKNTSTPQSLITLGLHAHIHKLAFKSLNWGHWHCCCSTPALLPACSLTQMWTNAFRGKTFLNQTTSKYWAQWSLHLPYSLSGDEVGVRYFWVRPLRGTWPVYFFLYGGCCIEGVQSKTWKNKRREHAGWYCGVSVLSLPVNLTNLFSVRLSEKCYIFLMFMFVRVFVLHWPMLSLVLLPFLVFFSFINREISS